jgi:hypothetical protein
METFVRSPTGAEAITLFLQSIPLLLLLLLITSHMKLKFFIIINSQITREERNGEKIDIKTSLESDHVIKRQLECLHNYSYTRACSETRGESTLFTTCVYILCSNGLNCKVFTAHSYVFRVLHYEL